MKQYVQHKSGQGERWEALLEQQDYWICKGTVVLPKSEYILCNPSEEWEDVTHLIEVQDKSCERSLGYIDGVNVVETSSGYRLRKLDLTYDECAYSHAVVVERKKT